MNEPELFNRLRELDSIERVSWAEKGMICMAVMRSMIHTERTDPETGEPCSFTSWVRLASPWGYQTTFAAFRDVQELEDIPAADLAKIPAGNVHTLKQLSTAVRAQPSVIQAAQNKRNDEFVEHIQKAFPDQHVETKAVLRFMASQTEKAEIEETITMAMERGAMNRTEALLAVCLDYRASVTFDEIVRDLK